MDLLSIPDNTTIKVEAKIPSHTIVAIKTDHSAQTCEIDVEELPISIVLINNPYSGGENDKVQRSGLLEIFDIRRFDITLVHNVNFIQEVLSVPEVQIITSNLIVFSGIFWMYADPSNAWVFQIEVPATITIDNL